MFYTMYLSSKYMCVCLCVKVICHFGRKVHKRGLMSLALSPIWKERKKENISIYIK